MQKVNRRQCQSEKFCSECGANIPIGAMYYSNPNVSWCDECKIKIEREDKEKPIVIQTPMPDKEPKIEVVKPKISKKKEKVLEKKNDSYVIKEPCIICGNDSDNSLVQGLACCLNVECQNKVIAGEFTA